MNNDNDEIKVLKHSNAGLRGENRKLKTAVDACKQRISELEQDIDDYKDKFTFMHEEIERLQRVADYYKKRCGLPWYKRIFKND